MFIPCRRKSIFVNPPESGAVVGAFAGLILLVGPELCTAAVETGKWEAENREYKVGVTQGRLEEGEGGYGKP